MTQQHRDFFQVGWLGILVGDGTLSYRPERIIETYYRVQLFKPLSVSFDYQYVVNPAYNSARGPVSVFAGRIADAGIDPLPIMAGSVEIMVEAPRSELIWASPREILNLVQADQVGCHVITMTHDLLKKLDCLGKSLEQYSLETVRMFHSDAVAAGFTL